MEYKSRILGERVLYVAFGTLIGSNFSGLIRLFLDFDFTTACLLLIHIVHIHKTRCIQTSTLLELGLPRWTLTMQRLEMHW